MNNKYKLRGWSDIAAFNASSNTSVILIEAKFQLQRFNELIIVVSGLARGSPECRVSINGDASLAEATASVDANGAFEVQLSADATILPPVVSLHARVDDGASVATDSVLLALDAAALPVSAVVQGLDEKQVGYGAGTADQLKLSFSFVKYDTEPKILTDVVDDYLSNRYLIARNGHLLQYSRSADANAATVQRIEGERDVRKRWRILGDHFRSVVETNTSRAEGPRAKKVSEKLARWRDDNPSARARRTIGSVIRVPIKEDDEEVVVDVVDVAEIMSQFNDIIAAARANLRLGILFHERLRVRPMRLVPGEPLYQLSLVPHEQVEIQQKTSTKTSTTLTESTDRESERNSSLSSTWSTDLSSSIESASSRQNSTSIGAGIDGKIPKINLGVGADAAADISEANSLSMGDTVTRHFETTSQAATRLRSQHKIQLEISTEETSALTSTRRLRNSNKHHSQHHKFYKIYRKEQVSLERFDARLCLKLSVQDPAHTLRNVFKAGIHKIHPRIQAKNHIIPPEFEHVSITNAPIRKNAPDYWAPPIVRPPSISRLLPWTDDLRNIFDVPENAKLATTPAFYLMGWETFDSEQTTNTDGTLAAGPQTIPKEYTKPTEDFVHTSSASPVNIEVNDGFDLTNENDTRFGMVIDFPVHFGTPLEMMGGSISGVNYVEFHIEAAWTENAAALEKYRRDLLEKESELAAIFRSEPVYDLVRIAEADYRDAVVSAALRQSLVYPAGFDMQRVSEILATEDAIIDSVGSWATPRSVRTRTQLQDLLITLPDNFSAQDVLVDALTASSAVVYLPIRLGKEDEALELLPEAREFADKKATDFRTFHSSHYGAAGNYPMPDPETHLGPAMPPITDAGAAEWSADWEKPQRRFDVLGQWAEYVPTDGVHVETHLSESVVSDSYIVETD